MSYQQHGTAVIDDGACIGDGTKIWHFTHVCSGATIGSNCGFGQNVYVGGRACVGDNVKVQNNVSIYDGVTLEDNVFCGPSVVFTNVINPRSAHPQAGNFSATLIKEGAALGANSTVVCGNVVGRYAFVGAGSVVSKDVPNYALVMGVPAKQVGWVSEAGHKLDLPVQGNGRACCGATGQKYQLIDGVLFRL